MLLQNNYRPQSNYLLIYFHSGVFIGCDNYINIQSLKRVCLIYYDIFSRCGVRTCTQRQVHINIESTIKEIDGFVCVCLFPTFSIKIYEYVWYVWYEEGYAVDEAYTSFVILCNNNHNNNNNRLLVRYIPPVQLYMPFNNQ